MNTRIRTWHRLWNQVLISVETLKYSIALYFRAFQWHSNEDKNSGEVIADANERRLTFRQYNWLIDKNKPHRRIFDQLFRCFAFVYQLPAIYYSKISSCLPIKEKQIQVIDDSSIEKKMKKKQLLLYFLGTFFFVLVFIFIYHKVNYNISFRSFFYF